MSILDAQPQINPATQAANQLIRKVKSNYERIFQMHEQGLKHFWRNSNATPQEIADELGTNASQAFQLHYLLYTLIKTANPEAKLTEVDTLGAFTIEDDGRITIDRVGPAPE